MISLTENVPYITLFCLQGVDYVNLRLSIQSLYYQLCSAAEAEATDHWYTQFMDSSAAHFETYEPDVVPALLRYEQRLRDTGNAFTNFAVEVLLYIRYCTIQCRTVFCRC